VTRMRYRVGEALREVRLESAGADYRVELDGRARVVREIRSEGAILRMSVDGRTVEAIVVADGDRRIVKIGALDPVTLIVPGNRPIAGSPAPGEADGRLIAPMDGQVVAVMARPGDRVETGAALVILEAMKMEMKVVAPFPGRIVAVTCAPRDVVPRGHVLIEIEPEAGPRPG